MMENKFILFFKGMLMGICDLIPGISGGTVAFITGIYERLINAVKGFSPELLSSLVSLDKKRINNNIKKLDLGFLFVYFVILFNYFLGSFFCFNAEHHCNANGGASPKLILKV